MSEYPVIKNLDDLRSGDIIRVWFSHLLGVSETVVFWSIHKDTNSFYNHDWLYCSKIDSVNDVELMSMSTIAFVRLISSIENCVELN